MLTFLAGAELDPGTMHAKWKEVIIVGLVGFAAPFLGCAALAHFALGWSAPSAWLAGIALSTTSMAVVYAVMLETGFNRTDFGKGILGACFVNDLGTVIALGLVFSPFTWRTAAFVAGSAAALALLPIVTPRLARRYANRTAAFRTKWVLFVLFGLGAGISREGCLVDMGSDENIVEKTGAWYSFEETRIGQGRENAKEFLRANPDIAQRIERKILDKHGVKTANGKSQAPAAPADAATPSTADDKPQKPAKKG